MDPILVETPDVLLRRAQQLRADGRPATARAVLLEALRTCEQPPKPFEADLVRQELNDIIAEPTREDREVAWHRLLVDVGWRPALPALTRLPGLAAVIDCGVSEHLVSIDRDWRFHDHLSDQERAEHIAAALSGTALDCAEMASGVPHVMRWASIRQRLAPRSDTWIDDDSRLQSSEPWEDGWDHDAFLDDDVAEWRYGDASFSAGLLSTLVASESLRSLVQRSGEMEGEPELPAAACADAAPVLLGGAEAVRGLWGLGVHPELVLAIHETVAVTQPIEPVVVAQLVLRRTDTVVDFQDDPLPISTVIDLLGRSSGRRRSHLLAFLAAAGSAKDADNPSRLMAWWDAVHVPWAARIRLHRAGFDPADLSRWTRQWDLDAGPGLAAELRELPPRRSADVWWGNVAENLAQGHLDRAHTETIPHDSQELHVCESLLARLSTAVEFGESGRILRVAQQVDRQHTSADLARGTCPVWAAAAVQAMLCMHPVNAEVAAGIRRQIDSAWSSDHAGNRSAVLLQQTAHWVWLALEREAGRLSTPVASPTATGWMRNERPNDRDMLHALLEEQPKTSPSVSDAREAWSNEFGTPAPQGWRRLWARGITGNQVRRWHATGPDCSPHEYVAWLAGYAPSPSSGEPGPTDPIAWLVEQARLRARIWAESDHSRLWENPEDHGLEEQETLSCLTERYPELEQAMAAGDQDAVSKAAEAALSGHTYYRDYKSYRYHLDTCPVADLARVILGVAAYPTDLKAAWSLLTGDNPDYREGLDNDRTDREVRHPSIICMATWLALTYRDGRLIDDPIMERQWIEATRSTVEGAWLMGIIIDCGRRDSPRSRG